MTDLLTNSHNRNCHKLGKSVKVLSIDLDNGETTLECGCKILTKLEHRTVIFKDNSLFDKKEK